MTQPITVEGKSLSLAHITISKGSQLIGLTVENVEQNFDVSVVLIRRDHHSDFHPSAHLKFYKGDAVAILGGPSEIAVLAQENL
jgi:K+/H+ antiporter YhaU regulatory subunit KhtT